MGVRLEAPTRQRWLQVLAQHAAPEDLGIRRTDLRHSVEFGAARLTFEDERGRSVERSGRLLNISEGGLMLKQSRRIPIQTDLRIEVTLGDDTLALIGRVVHATETLGGFKIGVELQFTD